MTRDFFDSEVASPAAARPPEADALAVFDARGHLLAWNPEFAALLSLRAEQVRGLDIGRYRELVLSSVADGTVPFLRVLEQLTVDPALSFHVEVEVVGPPPRIVSLGSSPLLDRHGKAMGRVVIHRDVTERRRVEKEIAELASLPNVNPVPILKCDPEGAVRFMNRAAHALLAELGLAEASALLPPDYRERIREVLDQHQPLLGLAHCYLDRCFSVGFAPEPDQPRCMILIEDVTEHRRADEKIRTYAEELQVTNRKLRETQAALVQSEKMASLGNLVAGVAHEINTPVGAINSNSSVLSSALAKMRGLLRERAPAELAGDPELERILRVLEGIAMVSQTACERIVKLVRSLRNFARLDEAERKKADLHEGLESTLTLLHHELKTRIQVVRDFGAIPEIDCYPNQLNQVFMNILLNAAQATEKGTITIATRLDGAHVVLSFTDNGRGIAPEHLPKVFDPGFTTKGVGVGTGLGLAICHKIVTAHGRRIEVDSQLGRGTTFRVVLPVAQKDRPLT